MTNSNIMEIKISDIEIGCRHRKDMGDLESLAESIRKVTLLHPVGVTPEMKLVFGERRLRVCRDILQQETIEAKIVDIPAIALGEYHENCDRKDFTPSELVAIVESLRAYQHGGDRKSDQFRNSDDDRLTTEEALDRMGMKKDTYCRAKRVVDQGVPELVEAMDSGEISVFAASELAAAAAEVQHAYLERRPNEERWTGCGVKRHLRRLKTAERLAANALKAVSTPVEGDAIRIFHCPFQQLEELAGLQPASARLVCTDIPYGQEFLPEIGELAAMADRILVDGGLLVMYCGQYWLPEVMRRLGEHLTYRWVFAGVWEGDSNVIHPLGIASQWKPILVFSKGDWAKTGRCSDVIRMNGKEKDLHEWQQPLGNVQKLVEYFSRPGDLVVDPCGGGFTTALACHRLGRQFVGCDIDKAAVASGQERLAQERTVRVANCNPPPLNSVTQGDCIDLLPGLRDSSINLCLCSPPYAEQRKGQYASISEDDYPEFTLRWMEALRPKLTENGSVLIVIDPHVEKGEVADYVLRTKLLLREHGWRQHQSLIWAKINRIPLGHTEWPRHCYEEILWFSKTSRPFCDPWAAGTPSDHIGANNYAHSQWTRGKKPRSGIARITDVIFAPVSGNANGIDHPAQFPAALVEPLISTFCPADGIVLDPFAGSGTTLVAAACKGRKWYGFEIDPDFCKLVRLRLADQQAAVAS